MSKKNSGTKSPKKPQTRQQTKTEKSQILRKSNSVTDSGSSKLKDSPSCETSSTVNDVTDPEMLTLRDINRTLQQIVKNQENTMRRLSDLEQTIFQLTEEATDRHSSLTDCVSDSLDLISAEIKDHVSAKFEQISNLTKHSEMRQFTDTEPGSTDSPGQESLQPEETIALAKIILEEKKTRSVREQCRKVRRKLGLQWTQSLNDRKKFYRNFVKNYRKSTLYKQWIQESPDFIPLKYKPKRIPGEIPTLTAAKIEEAKRRYKNDVDAMTEYSKIHQARVTKIDSEMKQLISQSCEDEEQATTLQEMWREETLEQEDMAAQLWLKTERFLNKKKHDDENKQEATLVTTSWAEILSRRSRKIRRPAVQQSIPQHWQYNVLPSPW